MKSVESLFITQRKEHEIWFYDDVYLKAIRTKNKFKDLFRTKYDDVPFEDYVPFDDCEF